MKNNMILTIISVLVVGVAAFFGGVQYQKSQQAINGDRFFARQGLNGANGVQNNRSRTGMGMIIGDILSKDDQSVTVKMQDGSSKIILFSASTSITKSNEGSKDDLKVGEKVGVFGTTNSDGSVTAQNIQLNPTFRIGNISPRPTQNTQPQ